jgi:hypothetical protein
MEEGGLTGLAACNSHRGVTVGTHQCVTCRSSMRLLLDVNVITELRISHCITSITKNTGV